VVVTPDTDPALVSELIDALDTAEAQVTGEVDVLPSWIDPEQSTVLAGLATQLAPADADVGSGNVYANAGAALASALVTNDAVPPTQSDDESVALLTGFQEGGFISVSGDPAVRAQLALVVSPAGPAQPDDATSAYADALLPLVAALGSGQGAVLVGPSGSAQEGGLVAALRASGPVRRTVSSDDVADLASGPVATVLALVQQQAGVTGQYGVGPGAEAALPPVPAVRPVRR
jgi:Copper transport outer membrane protein, MctB